MSNGLIFFDAVSDLNQKGLVNTRQVQVVMDVHIHKMTFEQIAATDDVSIAAVEKLFKKTMSIIYQNYPKLMRR